MAYENSGRLFKNDHKTADNHPDYTGDFTDERGKKWRCAAWIKDGERGKWMSFKVSEQQRPDNYQETVGPETPDPRDAAQQGPNTGKAADVDDSEIPF